MFVHRAVLVVIYYKSASNISYRQSSWHLVSSTKQGSWSARRCQHSKGWFIKNIHTNINILTPPPFHNHPRLTIPLISTVSSSDVQVLKSCVISYCQTKLYNVLQKYLLACECQPGPFTLSLVIYDYTLPILTEYNTNEPSLSVT